MTSRAHSFVVMLVAAITTCAAAQVTSATLNSSLVTGFETPFAWGAKSSSSSKLAVSSTITRTQGNYAYVIFNPGNLVTVTSAPVASTAPALAGLGNPGSFFEVDVNLPTVVGNTNNTGQMQMYVTSPSRGLSKVLVGDVFFSTFRSGIYNTMEFPISDSVRAALDGATFNDLTFILMISSPGQVTGPYLLDNLRIHSVQLVDATINTQPPPGYGGSLDFVVFGGTPVTQTFNIGVVQVPKGFHLKLGTVGATKVQLQLGYNGTASFTCTYGPDSTDPNGKSYILRSCTGGMQAGDLVSADWASLIIVGGDPSMKIRAQLALNPVGDTTGAGIIPAMPTFWGDSDGCVPTVVAAGVAPPVASSPSNSCAAQIAQANQIVTNYFNTVNNSNIGPNWIVTPTPELARRGGNGTPHNSTGPPPPGDPPFHFDGHVNNPPGGDWDAYYTLDGNFIPGQPGGTTISSHFDATGSGHVVLYGNDVNVLTVKLNVDTSLGVPPTNSNSASGSGSVHVYLFGAEIPTSNENGSTGEDSSGNLSPSIGFDVGAGTNQDYPGITIQIWIFQIEVDASTSIGLEAKGKIDLTGLHLSFGPHVDVGAHAFGGVDVGFASGGVDVTIPDLFHAALEANADATWNIDTDPTQCTVGLDFDANGTADISSGGGHVNLVASVGKCPFCLDESWDVFDWTGLGDTGPATLFDTKRQTIASVELPAPTTTCAPPLNVGFSIPTPTPIGVPVPVTMISAGVDGVVVLCSNTPPNRTWKWTSTVSSDALPADGCNGTAQFNTTGARTITLNVTDTVKDQNGTTIPLSGVASQSINVSPLPSGVYVTNVIAADGLQHPSYFCSTSLSGVYSCVFVTGFQVDPNDMYTACGPLGCTGFNVGPLTVVGTISQPPGPTSTTWTVRDTSTNISSVPLANDPSNPSTLVWTPPNLNTSYAITIQTVSGGSVFGTETITVTFASLH